jgi:hypothetical protein
MVHAQGFYSPNLKPLPDVSFGQVADVFIGDNFKSISHCAP